MNFNNIPAVLDPDLVGTEEPTREWAPDPLLLQACQLKARTTTRMRAVQWPPAEES